MHTAHAHTGVIIEKLTLDEFSRVIKVDKRIIVEMVEYQLFQPEGDNPEDWLFDAHTLKRAKTAVSFYHDLEVNMPGVALALELIDRIEDLQQQISIFEKMIRNSK